MNVIGRALARRPRNPRRAGHRALAALLLAAVALVPSLARAHDRLERQRTPAQEHSRFRWTNSCESVPHKTTQVVVVAPVAGPSQTVLPVPPRDWRRLPSRDVPLPVASPVPSPRPLRAPPALA
jgi:hypothetical protein